MNLSLLLCSVLLDWLLGDPHWLPHPVRWMGRMIAALEPKLRKRFPTSPQGELAAGTVLVLLMVGSFGGGCVLLLWLLDRISPAVATVARVWLGYQLLAARSLQAESMAVCPFLRGGDLAGARAAVGRIVGRDTNVLDEAGVTRAAVETVAENTSDGVIAPLFWMLLGGVPLGMAYKAINTLDSMVGYRNERYLYFGRPAARLDDAANLIPARLSGLLMCLSAVILPGFRGRGAWKIFLRDRRNHKSPNSAHTEAACAGALGVQLAGDAVYFGQVVEKPTIGDNLRPIQVEDIRRSVCLMYASEVLCLLAAGMICLILK
jgi:adenosylcobinamide-phosphate synthase